MNSDYLLRSIDSRVSKAIQYARQYVPNEEKSVRVKKERDDRLKKERGVIGEPKFTQDRKVNKLFDLKRS